MTPAFQLKIAAFEYCNTYISNRINTIEAVLKSLEESKNSESKSSVGDKYETGRAMIQLEEEKNKTQLSEALTAKAVLENIKIERKSNQVEIGSFVITNSGPYFIAIGIGKIMIKNELIYSISLESPIGQVLKNKQEGEEVVFNKKTIQIQTII